MSDEFSQAEFDDFMDLAVRSRLIDESQRSALVQQFHREHNHPFGVTITSFTQYLIAENVLTAWQCDKLRHKKYKGFFLDTYKLLDWLSVDENESYYLVQDVTTAKLYEIAVTPASPTPKERLDKGEVIYRLVRELST